MILAVIDSIGKAALYICNNIGLFFTFLGKTIHALCTTKLNKRALLSQMEMIGVNSFAIAVLTGTFTGAVLALQSYIAIKRFGGEGFIGPTVALSMTRELGPVLTGLMVTGRAGSAIAAEIGTMCITEQIDALRTLCINIWQYLIVPRVCASVLILPFLTLFTMVFGTIGGYIIAVYALHLNGEDYISGIKKFLELSDIINGLIKSSFFGLILAWVGCYKGFYTHGGARNVGIVTTQSVVIGSIMILITNYFLTIILF
jgi:phospholipid/cholesterol/gamma-HCH transport system permease protein